MICTQEKGHDGLCTAGSASGGCKKTAAKWFSEAEESTPVEEATPVVEETAPLIAAVEEVDVVEDQPRWAGLEVYGISGEEMEGSNEQQLAMLYRRHAHPSTRAEAVEWARDVVASRDLGVGA